MTDKEKLEKIRQILESQKTMFERGWYCDSCDELWVQHLDSQYYQCPVGSILKLLEDK